MNPILSFPREGEALDRKPPKESASPPTHVNKNKTKMKQMSRPGWKKWTTQIVTKLVGEAGRKKNDVIVVTVTLEISLICKA